MDSRLDAASEQQEKLARPAPPPRLEPLDPPRERGAAAMLALAFRDNPINRGVIGSDPRRRLLSNTYGMETSLRACRRFSFRRVLIEGDASGLPGGTAAALVALDPGGYPVAPPPIRAQLRCLWGQGLAVMRRWAELYRLLDECHPKGPHCYLSLIATHPDRRGRGLGRHLLEVWLRDVDARAAASYLETDRRELLPFYQSAGFSVEREIVAFDVPIWCMSRPTGRR